MGKKPAIVFWVLFLRRALYSNNDMITFICGSVWLRRYQIDIEFPLLLPLQDKKKLLYVAITFLFLCVLAMWGLVFCGASCSFFLLVLFWGTCNFLITFLGGEVTNINADTNSVSLFLHNKWEKVFCLLFFFPCIRMYNMLYCSVLYRTVLAH